MPPTIVLDIRQISTEIRSGKGFLHAGLHDPAGGELVKNLSVAAASLGDLMKELSSVARSLNNVVTKVESEKGTLGGIINDPSVYEDLKVILGGPRRVGPSRG